MKTYEYRSEDGTRVNIQVTISTGHKRHTWAARILTCAKGKRTWIPLCDDHMSIYSIRDPDERLAEFYKLAKPYHEFLQDALDKHYASLKPTASPDILRP